MTVISACQVLVLLSIGCCRLIMATFPSFTANEHFWASLGVGLLSDTALFFAVGLLLEMLRPLEGRRAFYVGSIMATVVSLICFVGLTAHLRYVQYFGVTFHPMHLSLVRTGTAVREGVAIAFGSTQALLSIAIPIVGVFGCMWLVGRYKIALRMKKWHLNVLTALLLAPLFNSLNMHFRGRPGLDRDMIYNPITAFSFKSKAFAAADGTRLAAADISAVVRDRFGPHRAWSENGQLYPLFQDRIAEDKPLTAEHERVRSELIDFVKREEQAKGPWNVLVILLESFRVDGLEGYEPKGQYIEGIAPGMMAGYREGIRFTEAMTAGDMTQLGQAAAMCSLYSVPQTAVLPHAPTTDLICLPDIFANEGYETYFISGSDNSFDNQKIFYPYHQTRHVVSVEDFPAGTPRGNWGISDGAVFASAVKRLAAGKKPFFATILTLSNHMPFSLPEDAPSSIDRSLPPRYQLRQYVDWAWQRLYASIKEKLPHTIVVLTADHGVHFPDEQVPKTNIPYDTIRTQYRIPFSFIIPGMPESIGGKTFDNVVSLVDLPPTLLKLLGKEGTPQQFMGHEAFSRREPLLINWGWSWYWTHLDGEGRNPVLQQEPIPETHYAAWGALQKYNRFAPKSRAVLSKAR